MRDMTLIQIAKACNGTYVGTDEMKHIEVTSVVLDSRKAEEGTLFIATRGERVDGHDFIDDVFSKGAICVISERELPNCKGVYIKVEDSFQALKDIAKYYRSRLHVKVVGITGSVGKTSTKEMIASVLSQKYCVQKTAGNFNNEVGLPLTILSIRDEHEIAVVEMGISNFGEMHRLSDIARPDVCVITNIGNCHLENLGTREGILRAKSEIFDFINEDGAICLNGDDALLAAISDVKGIKPLFFGVNNTNSIYATDVTNYGLKGTSCKIHVTTEMHTAEGSFDVTIPIPGGHMVSNALAATAVGVTMGLSFDFIQKGIGSVEAISGRSHLMQTEQYMIIDDCYNANPMSMKAAIELLSYALTRKVAFLGDMFELGLDSDRMHEEVGVCAVKANIDVLICVGENSKHMKDAAEAYIHANGGNTDIRYYETREEAIDHLHEFVQQGDTILVKASHGMGFQQVVELLHEK